MIFYFSATGNSLWCARQVAGTTHDYLINIAEALKKEELSFPVGRGEKVGFAFPVYGWDIPPVVLDFIRRVTLPHYQADTYTYFLCTCGDDTGRLLQRFRRIASQKGWHVDSGFALQMPNTYVCLPGFDVDARPLATQKLQQAPATLQQYCQTVLQRKKDVFPTRPGAFPRMKTHILGRLFHSFLLTDRYFHATPDCNGCGICTACCPTLNISLDGNRPVWHGRCTGCLSCYHHCPRHAVAFGHLTRHKGQYLLKKPLAATAYRQHPDNY